jgi:hypothetical protein
MTKARGLPRGSGQGRVIFPAPELVEDIAIEPLSWSLTAFLRARAAAGSGGSKNAQPWRIYNKSVLVDQPYLEGARNGVAVRRQWRTLFFGLSG